MGEEADRILDEIFAAMDRKLDRLADEFERHIPNAPPYVMPVQRDERVRLSAVFKAGFGKKR